MNDNIFFLGYVSAKIAGMNGWWWFVNTGVMSLEGQDGISWVKRQ